MNIEFIRHTTWEYLCGVDRAEIAVFLGREVSEEEWFASQDLDDEIQRKLDAMSDAEVLEIFYQQRNKITAELLKRDKIVFLENRIINQYEGDRQYFS